MKRIAIVACINCIVLLLCLAPSSIGATHQVRKGGNVYSSGIEALNEIDRHNMDLLDDIINASEASLGGDSNVSLDQGDLDEDDTDDWYKITIPSTYISEKMVIILATDKGQSEVRVCQDDLTDERDRAFTFNSLQERSREWIRAARPQDLAKEITFTPEPGKTYYINVRYIGGGPINYSLVIDRTGRSTLDLSPWRRNGLLQVDPRTLADVVQSLDNTCDQANAISGSYIWGTMVSDTDKEDWYKFEIGSGYNPLKVTIDANGGESSLTIYGSCEGIVLGKSDNPGSNEGVVVDRPSAGTYYLCVRHISGDPTNYSLTISGAPNPCADDTTPPETTISGCPNPSELPSGTTEYKLDLGGSDNCTDPSALRFKYALIHDGALVMGWTDTPVTCDLTSLSPGEWDFYARAIDDASNTDRTPAHCGFLISLPARPRIFRPR